MNAYDLCHMARITASVGTRGFYSPARFIYDAFMYAEKKITIGEIQDEMQRIGQNKMRVETYDYCLAILSGRAIPLWRDDEPKRME